MVFHSKKKWKGGTKEDRVFIICLSACRSPGPLAVVVGVLSDKKGLGEDWEGETSLW